MTDYSNITRRMYFIYISGLVFKESSMKKTSVRRHVPKNHLNAMTVTAAQISAFALGEDFDH